MADRMDFSKYKLTNDWSWYMKHAGIMGEDLLKSYINRVYVKLNRMQAGETFDITQEVIPENYELFVKSSCWFIVDFKPSQWKDYSFSEDYTKIYCR